MNAEANTTITEPIAERRLEVAGEPGRFVTVKIGKPCPDPVGDWVCPVHIDGMEVEPQHGRGVDATQALMEAFSAVRYMLDQSGLDLSWDVAGPGITAYPKLVPYFLGREFQTRIEKMIEREVKKFAKAAGGPKSSRAKRM
jgi:hypothetical protein